MLNNSHTNFQVNVQAHIHEADMNDWLDSLSYLDVYVRDRGWQLARSNTGTNYSHTASFLVNTHSPNLRIFLFKDSILQYNHSPVSSLHKLNYEAVSNPVVMQSKGVHDNNDLDSFVVEYVDPAVEIDYRVRFKKHEWNKPYNVNYPIWINCPGGPPCQVDPNPANPKGFYADSITGDVMYAYDNTINSNGFVTKFDTFVFYMVHKIKEYRKDAKGDWRLLSIAYSWETQFIGRGLLQTRFPDIVPWPWEKKFRPNYRQTAPVLYADSYRWDVCEEDSLRFEIFTTPSQRPDLPMRFDNHLFWDEVIPGANFYYADSNALEKTGVFEWSPVQGKAHSQPYRFTAHVSAADTCKCYGLNSRTFLVYVHEKPTTRRQYDSFSCGGFNARAVDTITIPGAWQYEWKLQSPDGMQTFDEQTGKNARLQAPKGGTYRVQLLSSGPENVACPARYVDTVTIDSFVAVSLPRDTAYCQNETIRITSQLIEGKPITYHWSTGDSAGTSIQLRLTQDSMIKLQISDSAGCKNEANMRIKMHPLPQFELPEDSLLCTGSPYTAQLPALPANAKNHIWNEKSSDSSYQQQAPGIIRLQVTDSNHCSHTDSMQLHSPSNSGYQWSLPDSLCRNESLTPGIVIASGHQNQQQSFELNGRNYSSWPANYRLRTDSLTAIWRIRYDSSTAMGCIAERKHTIYAHELPIFSLEVPKDTLCSSALPWQPALEPKPQESTTIRWQMSTGTDSLQLPNANPTEQYSSPQSIQAIAESRAGCVWKDSTRITIAYADQLSLSITPEAPNPNQPLSICKGEHITLSATSRQNKAISWRFDESYLEELNATPNSRTYRIKDSFGTTDIQIQTAGTAYCPPASITQAFNIHSYPKASILGLPAEDCEPLQLQLRSAIDTAMSTRWEQNGNTVSNTSSYSTSLNAGTYTIKMITTGTHCSDTAEANLTIKPRPEIGIQIRPGREVYIDQPEINLRALFPFGGEPEDHRIDWQLGDGNTGTGERISHRYRDTGQFTIILSATNSDNCNSRDSLKLRVWPKAFYLMPTAFSPNGDGINDRFSPRGNGIATLQMDIYTRWGARIYSGTEPDSAWDCYYRRAHAHTGSSSAYLALHIPTPKHHD